MKRLNKLSDILNVIQEAREQLHKNCESLDEDSLELLSEIEHEIKMLKKDF